MNLKIRKLIQDSANILKNQYNKKITSISYCKINLILIFIYLIFK